MKIEHVYWGKGNIQDAIESQPHLVFLHKSLNKMGFINSKRYFGTEERFKPITSVNVLTYDWIPVYWLTVFFTDDL